MYKTSTDFNMAISHSPPQSGLRSSFLRPVPRVASPQTLMSSGASLSPRLCSFENIRDGEACPMPPLAPTSFTQQEASRDPKVPRLSMVQCQSGIWVTGLCRNAPQGSQLSGAQSGELGIQFQAAGVICLFVFQLVFSFNSGNIICGY